MRMKDLRFGVIGWGYWGPKIARNLDTLPNGMVTMVADTDAHRLASLEVNQPWVQTTLDIKDALSSDVDGVIIATPVRTHYYLAKEALLQGKHVLVEKPLTANVAEAEDLVALAQQQQRILMVGHTFEYSPAVNVIWDLAPHDISILLYLLSKKPEQIKVQAHAHLQSHIHDMAHLDLEYADGMTAHIHVSWLHPCKVRRVTVIGDVRMAVYDDTNPAEMLKIYNKGAHVDADPVVSYRFGEITIPHIDWVEPLRLECEDFARAIVTGTQPRAHGGVGLEVVRVLAAAQEALEKQERQNVKIPV
jgi:predicted dehydrogenase